MKGHPMIKSKIISAYSELNPSKIFTLVAVLMLSLCESEDLIAAPLQPKPSNKSQQLLERIEENDRLVKVLMNRIRELEMRIIDASAEKYPPKLIISTRKAPANRKVAWQESSTTAPAPKAAPTGPATMEIDQAAAQRALERTLTQSGALLLPSRTLEVTPVLSYNQFEHTISTIGNITIPGSATSTITIVPQNTRANETLVGVGARLGLQNNLQAELFIPYSHMRGLRTDNFGGARSARGAGWGDITVGIAKTLFREHGWRPDLIGRFSYNTGSGRSGSDLLPFSGGYRQAQAQLVALKRQDPLAFTVEGSFNKVFEKDGIRPGDIATVNLGVALAASPETSLQFGYRQIWRGDTEVAGRGRPGSSQNYGILTIGASSVLSRDLTAVTQVGIGVGQDAPKYTISVAFPFLIR
jgi:hypothetical protein